MQSLKWYETFSPVHSQPLPSEEIGGRTFKKTPGREWLYTQARKLKVLYLIFIWFYSYKMPSMPEFFNHLITGSQVASDSDCLLLKFCMGVLKWLFFRSQKYSGKKFKRTGSRLSACSLIKFFFQFIINSIA